MGFDPNTKHKTTTTVLGPIEVGGDYIFIRDEKANASLGGTFTQGAWRTRTLNTIVQDDTGNVTLSSNQFTLPIGTYRIHAHAPAHACSAHKSRLRNITDSTTELVGRQAFTFASAGADTSSQLANIEGEFTISSAKTFEIQHYCSLTQASSGFGAGALSGDGEISIFTEVQLIKVA